MIEVTLGLASWDVNALRIVMLMAPVRMMDGKIIQHSSSSSSSKQPTTYRMDVPFDIVGSCKSRNNCNYSAELCASLPNKWHFTFENYGFCNSASQILDKLVTTQSYVDVDKTWRQTVVRCFKVTHNERGNRQFNLVFNGNPFACSKTVSNCGRTCKSGCIHRSDCNCTRFM